MQNHTLLIYLLLAVAILPLLYRRISRMMKPQPLKLNQLWVRPIFILVLGFGATGAETPPPAAWPWIILAAALGAGLGWQWGRMMAIHVDPEKGTLMTRGSQAALILMVLLIAVRLGLRQGLKMEAPAWHLDAGSIADAFIVFSAFLFGVRGLEMYLRARKVLAEAKA